MKRYLSLVLALCLALAIFAMPANAEEEIVISYLCGNSGNTAADDNLVVKEMEKRLGFKINMIQNSDVDAKLSALIAAQDLPDVFSIGYSDAVDMIAENMIIPVDDLLEEYGPNILDEIGDTLKMNAINNINGKTYAMHTNYQNPVCNYMFRLDWLEALDMEMPTDLDELYDVLYAFTYGDPDGNGVDDTVGTILTVTNTRVWEPIFGAFGIAFEANTLLEDGTVTTYMKDEHYLECVEYIRRLYQDGLIDPEFATMPSMTAYEALWNGRCGAFAFQSLGITNNWYPGRYTFEVPEDPADLFGYTLLTGPYGDSGMPRRYPSTQGGFVISASCEHPEQAMQLIDFMFSEEGDELTYMGVEGVMWEWVDEANGKYRRLPGYEDDTAHRNAGGFVFNCHAPANNAELKLLNKHTQDAQAFDRAHAFDWPNIETTLPADTEYGATLEQITIECLAQLIVTDGDVEAEYAAFVERWENEGGLVWEAQATEAYNSHQ